MKKQKSTLSQFQKKSSSTKKQTATTQRDFTTMITHQLRTPLGAIRAAAQLLADGHYGPLSAEAKETAMLIQNASERLLTQTDTYLQALQVQKGTYRSKPEPVCVQDLLNQVIKELAPLGMLKKIKIQSKSSMVPRLLSLDRETFLNTVFNLLDNAIKYTDRGTITVNLGWRKSGSLVVEITDTGRGIAQSELKLIFNRAARGSAAVSSEVQGGGFGLYIIKQLLKASKGSIEAKSKGLGKGATFTVILPAFNIDEIKSTT